MVILEKLYQKARSQTMNAEKYLAKTRLQYMQVVLTWQKNGQ